MITAIEDYFSKGCGRCKRFDTPQCSARLWSTALSTLRRLCLEAGLTECVKWGHPCYMHAGRNIAMIGAFQASCCLSFFNAALLKDADGVLEKAGPNTRQASLIRITTADIPARLQRIMSAYLAEAMAHAEAGLMPPKEQHGIELPVELVDALDADPELAEAFQSLTPGRQRSYVINLSNAKTAATRISRITKFRPHIIAGKGANER